MSTPCTSTTTLTRYVVQHGNPTDHGAPPDTLLQAWAKSMAHWSGLPMSQVSLCIQHFTKLFKTNAAFADDVDQLAQVWGC